MLCRLTLYTSYEPQVPELNSGSPGNLKSLTPSSALPSQSLRLWWFRQQSHIPVLTYANNTHTCRHRCHQVGKFLLFWRKTRLLEWRRCTIQPKKKWKTLWSHHLIVTPAGLKGPHLCISGFWVLLSFRKAVLLTLTPLPPKINKDAVNGVKLHFIPSEW